MPNIYYKIDLKKFDSWKTKKTALKFI